MRKTVLYVVMLTWVLSTILNASDVRISFAESKTAISSVDMGKTLSPKYDKKAGLYGYVDKNDKWVIEPKFTGARSFKEGLAAVSDGFQLPQWGYIKPDGTFVIAPKFGRAYDFTNGIAVIEDKGLAGTINKSGEYLVKPQYYLQEADTSPYFLAIITDVSPSQGAAKHKYGLITKKGAFIKPQFDGVPYLIENFINFYMEDSSMEPGKRKFFIAMEDGRTIPIDGSIVSVSEDMGLIEYSVDKALARSNPNRRYAFITSAGKIIKSYKDSAGKQYPFLGACDFSEGFACIAINTTEKGASFYDRWGYLKKDGTWLVQPTYRNAGSFKNGIAPVAAFSWGYINYDLSWYIKPKDVVPASKFNSAFTKNIDTASYSQSELDFTIEKAQSILKKIVNNSMSDYEKLDAIYAYITKNVNYDENFFSGNIPRVSYTAYGAFKYNLAVCEGYAEMVSLMLNITGIENKLIVGYINDSEIGHAWNLVQINGKYYHVDATWDAGNDRREYFMKSDAYMLENRTWDTGSYPIAKQDYK